ncbi:flagellar protein FliO/FliZ [Paenibacillus phyllosphaerae]|uniref:Flagellar protein FliO/FliZ n=1 Tax=Paenibacillus phyllosphaerae TaxID=274593 RepID=A0A7W5AVE0_9BACL|nr:flagellar biosynthetic protein FliO [Paenibacillus phyllosphaerae]MBB3109403.1 flagellar protein FliO/FliZ [Paenibacillus phyllosphaerae]
MKRLFLLTAGLASISALLPTLAAAAAETQADPEATDLTDPSPVMANTNMTGYLIWVIFALLLVTSLIVLVIKFLAQRNRMIGSNRSLRSLGGIPLGQNKSLQVLDLSGRLYVVGVGENISLIDKIDDPEEARSILQSLEQQQMQPWTPATFKDWIDRVRNRGKEEEKQMWQEADSFQSLLQSRLQRQSDQRQKVESLLKDENQNDRLLDE